MMRIVMTFTLLIICLFVLVACKSVPYTMTAPDQFKPYDSKRHFKFITADGVMLKARQVDNYPKANLSFWKDAMTQHMTECGYTLEKSHCFTTQKELEGCTLKFVLPHGAEDWVLSETIFVVEDIIVLVEVAGQFDRYQQVEKDLETALKTFSPNL